VAAGVRVYRHEEDGDRLYAAEVPDGSVLMEVGATFIGDRSPGMPPIVAIDFNRKMYQRESDLAPAPFPELFHFYEDIRWKLMAPEERAAAETDPEAEVVISTSD
jgi:hypothetical protein